MKSIRDAGTLATLKTRLESVTPDRQRVWGTMSPHQMLVHLAVAAEAATGVRPFAAPMRAPSRLLKWFALRAPLRWPRGVKAGADPASAVLAADAFAADRTRAVDGLVALASQGTTFAPAHPVFGPMARDDWHRWAYLHTDHHLRQFGL